MIKKTNKLFSLVIALPLLSYNIMVAQTADDIINKYHTTIGGVDAINKLTGIKMKAKVDAQGMTIPLEIFIMKDGKTATRFELMGKMIYQDVFDGETVWGTNFMTMKAEKSDAETTDNKKRDSKNFMSDFLNYKEKGYSVELLGKETAEGVECFKIKFTKHKELVDGQEVDNIVYYYFDAENFIPIMTEGVINKGQMKGQIAQTVFSDYQEVNGIYFAFSITSRLKDGQGQTVVIESVELNPVVEEGLFKFPEETGTEEKK